MRRFTWTLGMLCGVAVGCAISPVADNPLHIDPNADNFENPVLVAPGRSSPVVYAEVFERVYDVVREYFPVAYSNAYDGRIVATPTSAPGLEQIWKPGSPSAKERLYATLQTVRYRCFVQIRAAEQGGYYVSVRVFRELADDAQPQNIFAPAVFRDVATVDRSFNVVDPILPTDGRWIPKGRETVLEQTILRKVQQCQFKESDASSQMQPDNKER